LVLFSSRVKNPVIASVGGSKCFIHLSKRYLVVILTNLVGSRPEKFIEEIANYIRSEKK
jgi:hypothetical protein